MTDLTPKSGSISFMLVSYNQQSYIAEAVTAALAQDHVPLEIVLSDDCSTDRTFEVIEEIASAYRGPHTILTNRNTINVGLAEHLNVASRLCSGDIIIVAAGDDISHPCRASIIAEVFERRPKAYAVFSQVHDTTSQAVIGREIAGKRKTTAEIVFGGGGIGKGATYAYRNDCFDWPRPIPDTILSEDKFVPFRAALLGDVFGLDAELVAYRKPPGRLGECLKASEATALKRPEHFDALRQELGLASAERAISRPGALALRMLLAYRQATVADLKGHAPSFRKVVRPVQRLCRNLLRAALRIFKKRETVILER